jgi:hypothetical protein
VLCAVQVGDWIDASPCGVSCGGGFKAQTLEIVRPSLFGGAACPTNLARAAPCNTFSCESLSVPLTCGIVCTTSQTAQFANLSLYNATAVCTSQCSTGLLPEGTIYLSPPVPLVPLDSQLLPGLTRTCLDGIDCGALMRGLCRVTQFYGAGNPPRCTCNSTAYFTYANFQCTTIPPELVFRIEFNRTLYFTEQLALTTWRPRGTLPAVWNCALGSCRTRTGYVELFTLDTTTVAALMDPVNTLAVPLERFSWYCIDPRRRATMLTHELARGGAGFRPIDEYCLTCSQWCGPHGVCTNLTALATNFTCACRLGWTGARCTDSTDLTSLTWRNGSYQGSVSYESLRGCQEDADCGSGEQCYYPVTDPLRGGGRCFCRSGFAPNGLFSCGAVPVSTLSGVVLRGEEWRFYDVTYATADPHMIWYVSGGVVYAAYLSDLVTRQAISLARG